MVPQCFQLLECTELQKKATLVFDSVGLIFEDQVNLLFKPSIYYFPKPSNIFNLGISIVASGDGIVPIPFLTFSFTKVFGS